VTYKPPVISPSGTRVQSKTTRNYEHPRLSKIINAKSAAFDNALERPNRDRLASMIRHDHLPPVGMALFLMAARLTD
jgi:predicted membrane-bound dolichyl-phosphate-mannose-protein mannosyltransferase